MEIKLSGTTYLMMANSILRSTFTIFSIFSKLKCQNWKCWKSKILKIQNVENRKIIKYSIKLLEQHSSGWRIQLLGRHFQLFLFFENWKCRKLKMLKNRKYWELNMLKSKNYEKKTFRNNILYDGEFNCWAGIFDFLDFLKIEK